MRPKNNRLFSILLPKYKYIVDNGQSMPAWALDLDLGLTHTLLLRRHLTEGHSLSLGTSACKMRIIKRSAARQWLSLRNNYRSIPAPGTCWRA